MNTASDQFDISKPSGEMSVDGSFIEKDSPPPYVTFRKGITQSANEKDFLEEFNSFKSTMFSMMESWLSKQDEKFSKILNEFEAMRASVSFMSDKYDDLEKKIYDNNIRVSELEQKINNLQSCESRVTMLEAKLQTMDQKSRSCNVEISNLPEKRGENLMSLLENIASVIKQPLTVRDVITVHRVPQMQSSTHRPKNVIVKFASQIIRDNFIAAARLKKGITSDELKIHGNSQKIYINEHLTLYNKSLFRQAREISSKNGYRFTWFKHGVVLVRADVSTSVIAIRSEKDLSKLKPINSKDS